MPDFRDKVRVSGARATRESALALWVFAEWDHGEPRTVVFPKSQIDDDSEVWQNGQEGTFVCSEWIAEQKEVI